MSRHIIPLIILTLIALPLGCSDSTAPTPLPPAPAVLAVSPATGAPGTAVRIAGADLEGLAAADLSLSIGGQPALLRLQGTDIIAAIPMVLGTAAGSATPLTGTVDIELMANDRLIGEAAAALTITAPPAAPGAATSVSDDLGMVVANLDRFVSALEAEPSPEAGYLSSWLGALKEIFTADHTYSLPTLLSDLGNTDPEALATIESVFASSGLQDQTQRLAAYSATLADEAEALALNAEKTTNLLDYQLALRMQFYVVLRDFGADVIADTNQTWSNTVGLVGGVIGIGGVSIPAAGFISAVLSLADFAINKVALGYFPAHITSFEIALANPLVVPGDVPQTELWLDASNQPVAIGVQDFIDLLLLGLGQATDGSAPQTFRDFLTNTADWYLGIVRTLMGAYSNAHPELNMDIDVGSIPPMTWRTQVTSDRFAALSTLTPDIINPVDNILAWRAEMDASGEGRIFARPASGPAVTSLPMPPGYVYNAGAFGDDIVSTPTVSVFVGNQLVLDASMSSSISAGGTNGLGVRAGYRDALGNVTWAEGIQIQCDADGGTVDPVNGVTDTDGRFDTFVMLDDGSSSVTVTVTATGDFGMQQTQSLTANRNDELTIDLSFPTTIEPGVPTSLNVTVTSTGSVDDIELDIDGGCAYIEVDSATLGASGGSFQTNVTLEEDCNSVFIEVSAYSGDGDKAFASASVEATRPNAVNIVERSSWVDAQTAFYYGDPVDDETRWEFNQSNNHGVTHFGDFEFVRTANGSGTAEGMDGSGSCFVRGTSNITLSGQEFSGASYSAEGEGSASLSNPHSGRYGLSASSGNHLDLEFVVWGTEPASFTISHVTPGGGFIETWVELDGESFDEEEEIEICFENGAPCDPTNKKQGPVKLLYDAAGRLIGATGTLPPGEYTFEVHAGGYLRFSDSSGYPSQGSSSYDFSATASLSISGAK